MEVTKVSTYVLKDSHDYPTWSGKIQAIVQSTDKYGGVDILTKDGGDVEEAAKLKLFNYLLISTDGRPQRIVMRSPRDGVAAWEALKDEYAPDDASYIMSLKTEFFQTGFDSSDDIDSFLDRLEDIQFRSEVTKSSSKITDEEVKAHVCRTLPDRYYPIISVCETGTEWSKLRKRLRDFDRRMPKSTDAFSHALVASSTGSPAATTGWCDFCEQKGHCTKDCRAMQRAKKLYQEQKSRQGGRRNQSGGGPPRSSGAVFFGPTQVPASRDSPKPAPTAFVVDSGASQHICGNPSMFTGPMDECDVNLTMVNGETVRVTKRGTVVGIVATEHGGHTKLTIKGALFLPGNINLLSVHRISEAGHRLQTGPRPLHNVITLDGSGMNLPLHLDEQGLRYLEVLCDPEVRYTDLALAVTADNSSKPPPAEDVMVLHKRLGHLNHADMQKLERAHAITTTGTFTDCETCLATKSKRAAVSKKAAPRFTVPGSLIHTDINGPMSVPTISGQRYAIGFIDDATRYVTVYLMKSKNEALSKFQAYIREMMPLGIPIGLGSTLQADNDSVYRDSRFADFAKQQGIKMRFSPPHTQAQNGIAERGWNTLVDMARAMLHDAGLDQKFWGAAMLHSAFVRNVCPASATSSAMTPFEMIHGQPFDITKLRKFGAQAFVHVERSLRTKFTDKSQRGMYIGHALHSGTHLVYLPGTRRVVESIHVKFIETSPVQGEPSSPPPRDGPQPISVDLSMESTIPQTNPVDTNPPSDDDDSSSASEDLPASPSTVANDSDDSQCDLLSTFVAATTSDPRTLRQAQASPDADKWVAAMHAEVASLKANNTWAVVNKHEVPRQHRILQSKFIFKTKLDQHGAVARYKARLVALGNLQREGVDFNEVYAPVAHLVTLRVFFALAAYLGRVPSQMDIVTAFLQADGLTETVYVAPPNGMDMDPDLIFRLLKPIYGLKQSPREWNKTIHAWLTEQFGLQCSQADPCLYFLRSDAELLVLVIWVDDIVYFATSQDMETRFAKAISDRFDVKHLGAASFVLGIQVRYTSAGIILDQQKYITEILAKLNMIKCKPAATPMVPHTTLCRYTDDADGRQPEDSARADLPPELARLYREVVGSLIYLVSCTRPDIANAVSQLSQCVSHPLREHLNAAKHVLRYLRGTAELGIRYSRRSAGSDGAVLVGYADASFGSVPTSRRSITGYVFLLANGAISWKTRVQPTVALSTAEAEYMAACSATQEAKFLRNILDDLGMAQPPTVIFEDNQPAIHIAENRLTSQRSKHIDIKYHFIREAITDHIIKLVYVPTHDQLADILTKILPADQTARLRGALLGHHGSPQ